MREFRDRLTRIELSVVIPTYNEERRIEPTIRIVHDYLAQIAAPFEVVVSDDGSVDCTSHIASRLAREGLCVRLILAEKHRGKGAAVRRGVLASRGDLVLITDADLSTPMSQLPKLLRHVRLGADIAIGSRALRDSNLIVRQPMHREWSGRAFNLLVRAILLPDFRDTQCGFKLMRGAVARELLARATVDGFAYDVEVLALAVRMGMKVVEVPVAWVHDSESKVSLGRDAMSMLFELIGIAVKLRSWIPGRVAHRFPADASRDSPVP